MARLIPFLIFLAVALSVLTGLHYYVWLRLVRDPALPGTASRVLTALLTGLALSMPLTFIAARVFPNAPLRPLVFLAFVWMGAGFLFASLFFATDLGRLAVQSLLYVAARLGGSDGPADPARRLFISRAVAGGVGALAVGLSATGMRSALGAVQVSEQEVKLRGLPAALAGLKLVQISDVHIGSLLQRGWLQGVVDRIQALGPDLIVITGDLVDGSVAELARHVEPLGQLRAPRGVYFVTGNHEYYSGAEQWLLHLPRLGIRPLRNERLEIAPGLDLAGIDDHSAPGKGTHHNLERALAGRDPARTTILLAHQPKQFVAAAERGVHLTLSGHTHGGQIWPFGLLVGLQQGYVAGLYQRGDSQLYVSRGTGFWGPPLRVFAPAEITLLKLQPA